MNPSEALKMLVNNSNLKPTAKKVCENMLRPAINKQVPIKVYNDVIPSQNASMCRCPICKSYVIKSDNYCRNCGQAIKWK